MIRRIEIRKYVTKAAEHGGHMCAQLLSRVQLCTTLDCNPTGSSIHRVFQARILERVSCPPPRGHPIGIMDLESGRCGIVPQPHWY